MGNSGMDPPKSASESYFVATEDFGRLDVAHEIVASGQVVAVSIKTTRYVGALDDEGNDEGFLKLWEAAVERGTLAEKLVLTIRAKIAARDAGGTLGRDGLEVEAFLHKETDRERSLGKLEGSFGSEWQTFRVDVDVGDVRFPADPCGDSSTPCGRAPEPRPNEISLKFTGDINAGMGMTIEVDWLTLEPKDEPGLAWRPVLLAHGWNSSAAELGPGTAWADGLALRDVSFHAVDLGPGLIPENAAKIAAAVADLSKRFGVERVNVVGHSKGGVDTREHVQRHDDVETLIMLATPNGGSFLADTFCASWVRALLPADPTVTELTSSAMRDYNDSYTSNRETTYVAAAGAYNSPNAQALGTLYGPNDETVSVASVQALPYSSAHTYITSTKEDESQGICAEYGLSNHSCLRYYSRIVNELFPRYLAVLTAPPAPFRRFAGDTTGLVQDEIAAVVQGVTSDAAIVPPAGVTKSHAVLIDAAETALFYVFVEGNVLRLELVSPTGTRIDATTPQTAASVVHAPLLDSGPFFSSGYHIQAPETGNWTLEVTGTGVPSADSSYGLAALVALPPGTGVALATAVDSERWVIGEAITITATVTADGVPVSDAIVRAQVAHPDGATTTEVVLVNDGTGGDAAAGDGQYTGVFAATTLAGLYTVVVSAEGTAAAFSREQLVQFSVSPSATAFSGTVSDHGLDSDGDGRYDELVVDVGVDVDVDAAYRLFGTLTDGAGTPIEQVRVEQQLAPGSQTVSLSFDGARLFKLGLDGPYLLEGLAIEDVATLIGLDHGAVYTTAAYAHTDFQRPPCLLTGNANDYGAHTVDMERLPYEELVVEVEVDSLTDVDLEATANLYVEDDTFIAAGRTVSSLAPGLGVLEFRFPASEIFRASRPGPFTLRLLSMWGASTDGAPVSLLATGVVAVTQPYRLEDFAESPRYTVGGTLTGLVGTGQLELEITAEAPPGSPTSVRLHPRNGPFTFTFPMLVSGNTYEVRVTQQPTSPVQVCTVTNASGTIEDANVTDIEVHCV